MKLLFLSKRRPQGRDLVERPYGRFHWLPKLLRARGHDARLVLVGHAGDATRREVVDGLPCVGFDLRRLGPRVLRRQLREEASGFAPDWIVGCSDAWLGVMARALARHARARLALDAYDNFESYMPWNLPLHLLWRRAVARADLVTAAGPQLAARLQSHRRGGAAVAIVPMAADPAFQPGPRAQARRELGLPTERPLFGYFGGWAQRRGTDLLLGAFSRVRASQPQALLVLSGRPPARALAAEGVHALGYLPDARLPVALNAVDVACVLTADSAFGRFSYPAKLCEAMACRRPLVASDSGPIRWMLGDSAPHLVPLGDASALAEGMLDRLRDGAVDYAAPPGWEEIAAGFDALLCSAIRSPQQLA